MVEFGNRVVAVCGIVASLATWHASRRVVGLPRWVRPHRACGLPRDRRPDPARRHHGHTRPPSARGDVPLPPRARGRGVVRDGRVRGMEPCERPGRAGGAPLAPRGCRRRRRRMRGDGRHRRDRDCVGAASGRRSGRPPPRARDPRHGVRPRPRDGGVRGGAPARGLAARPGAASGSGRRPARDRAPRSPAGADARRRDPVPERPSMGACARARDTGRGVWALTVATAYALWRPPLALVAPSAERVEALGEPLRSR